MTKHHITILGAGIAGLSVAIALKKAGYTYTIYETASELKPVGAGLGLGANAAKGFKKLGIDQEVLNASKILDQFNIVDQKGRVITETNTKNVAQKYGIGNYTIHRAELHDILISHAGREHVMLDKRSVSAEQHSDRITVHFADQSSITTKHLIVADGIHSAVRQQLNPASLPRYAGYTCWRAVVENFGLENDSVAIETWGTKGRFGIVPLTNNRVYWYACINAKPNDPKMRNLTPTELQKHFEKYHSPIAALLDHTHKDQLIWNDLSDIKPLSRYAYGNTLLVGDAAHATTPNMGQGACQAIEDAACLAKLLEDEMDLHKVFRLFEQARIKRTHWVINRSRSLGMVAQTGNPLLAATRNTLFRSIPKRMNEKQLKFLYDVDFM